MYNPNLKVGFRVYDLVQRRSWPINLMPKRPFFFKKKRKKYAMKIGFLKLNDIVTHYP